MDYRTFAQRYRPTTFSEVFCQEDCVRQLQNSFLQNKLASVYLFHGPHGIGKTTIARIFAKLLNCQSPDGAEPCNKCDSCIQIKEQRSMDVIEIDAASNRRIDEVRQLRENVKFAPVSSKYRVYIIDEVHMLTLEAFNALLKTLEEPPAHIKFILATTHPHKLPPTIISRCQRFELKKASKEETENYLLWIAKKEGVSVSEQVLKAISEKAQGSLRDACSMFEQFSIISASGAGDDIPYDKFLAVIGMGLSTSLAFEMASAVIEGSHTRIIEILDSVISEGGDLARFVDSVERLFRGMLFLKDNIDLALVSDNSQEREFILEKSKALTKMELYYIAQIFIKLSEWVRLSQLHRFAIEVAFLKMADRKNFVALGNLTFTPQRDQLPSQKPTVKTVKREVSQPQPHAMHREADEIKRKLIEYFESKREPLLVSISKDIVGYTMRDNQPVIVFSARFPFEQAKSKIARFNSALKEILAQDCSVVFEMAQQPASKGQQKSPLDEKAQAVMEKFDARIISRGRVGGSFS